MASKDTAATAVWNPLELIRECQSATRQHLAVLREIREALRLKNSRERKMRQRLDDVIDGMDITLDKLQILIDAH